MSSVNISPLNNQFAWFEPNPHPSDKDLTNKNKGSVDVPTWLSIKKFEISTTTQDKVKKIVNNLISVISLYGIYAYFQRRTDLFAYVAYFSLVLTARKIASIFIGYLVYPAALKSLFSKPMEFVQTQKRDQIRRLEGKHFTVKELCLVSKGVSYSAFLITHKTTTTNGKWALHALGNGGIVDEWLEQFAMVDVSNGCNTLLINGPAVGSSGGWPIRSHMGAGFEAGLRFLEEKVNAERIILKGHSLGGGMIAEAILKHDFAPGKAKGIRYVFVADRTFNYLSQTIKNIVGVIASPFILITGTELNGVGAAKKLSELGIPQIIIQHTSKEGEGTDDVISDCVSLARELHKTNLPDKFFVEDGSIVHSKVLPIKVEHELTTHIHNFLALP